MARIRQIKPGFFTNEILPEVPAMGRLLFIGLWTLADRDGRLEDRPRRIKAEIFPYEECDVQAHLATLEDLGFIVRYSHGTDTYIQIVNFSKHQHVHVNEAQSSIPPPEGYGTSTVLPKEHPEKGGFVPENGEYGASTVQVPEEHPSSTHTYTSTSTNTSGVRESRSTQIPKGFDLNEGRLNYALSKGLTKEQAELLMERMQGWAAAKGGVYKDWNAAWQNWVRDEATKQKPNNLTVIGGGKSRWIGPNDPLPPEPTEPEDKLDWLKNVVGPNRPRFLQFMYADGVKRWKDEIAACEEAIRMAR